jgi:hypothetical protein
MGNNYCTMCVLHKLLISFFSDGGAFIRYTINGYKCNVNKIIIIIIIIIILLLFYLALQPSAGYGLFVHEISRSHTATRHSR